MSVKEYDTTTDPFKRAGTMWAVKHTNNFGSRRGNLNQLLSFLNRYIIWNVSLQYHISHDVMRYMPVAPIYQEVGFSGLSPG